jgi:hypothetical protein
VKFRSPGILVRLDCGRSSFLVLSFGGTTEQPVCVVTVPEEYLAPHTDVRSSLLTAEMQGLEILDSRCRSIL